MEATLDDVVRLTQALEEAKAENEALKREIEALSIAHKEEVERLEKELDEIHGALSHHCGRE